MHLIHVMSQLMCAIIDLSRLKLSKIKQHFLFKCTVIVVTDIITSPHRLRLIDGDEALQCMSPTVHYKIRHQSPVILVMAAKRRGILFE